MLSLVIFSHILYTHISDNYTLTYNPTCFHSTHWKIWYQVHNYFQPHPLPFFFYHPPVNI